MQPVQSQLLVKIPGILHSFGTADVPSPPEFTKHWHNLPKWNQVHGIAVVKVMHHGQECGDTDALITRVRNLPVAVRTADCVPILLARTDGSAVAAVHAGRRGTFAGIVRSVWQTLSAGGAEKPGNWVAAIGPAIGRCCYDFDGHMLDLPGLNFAQLQECGITSIDLLRLCTRCTPDAAGKPAFCSYRRDGAGAGARQYSAIMIA